MDTEHMENELIEPAGDSRPIRFEDLLDHEKDLINRANRLLRGIHKDADRSHNSSNSSSDPWALVDDNRRHRVLMLSGPRGSGKTSLLLTLLAGWRAAWTNDWPALTDTEHRKEAEELFENMGEVVRPLKPLDFDPLPPDLPLYGWIVQAFRPLVDWLTNDGQAIGSVGFDHLRNASERRGGSLPWSENPQSLNEQLQKLYQMAIVGWGSGKLREAFQKDLFDLILDQEEQHLNWQRLQSSWHSFLNDLFKELDRRHAVFPRNGLLVLPIDDADLQIERDRELILAIRLLHHPRLVYLLTGYIENLSANLSLEFLGRMLALSNTNSSESKVVDISEVRSDGLANTLREKVLPTSHVLMMQKLTLHQALEWNSKKENRPLDKIFLDPNNPETSFHKFIEERPRVRDMDFDCVLFRRLQQFHDTYAHDSDFSKAECLADFLEMLKNVEDVDEFTVGRVSEDQIVLHTYPGPIVPVARVYHSSRPHQNIEVRVGINLEFNQERITTSLSEQSEENRLVQASPLTLLALDLAAAAPRIYVHQHTPRIRPPQCLAWSIWHSDSLETWLPWPSIGAASPTELVKRAEAWTQAVREINNDDSDNAAWVDRIAFAWIRLHLLWLGEKEGQLSVAHETSSDMAKAWLLLLDALKSPAPKVSDSQWFQREMPLLAAPEYGLSQQLRKLFLDTLSKSQNIPSDWLASRQESFRAAKWFEQGQGPIDWFTVRLNYRDKDISESERIKTLGERIDVLQSEISRAFPDSPDSLWYRKNRIRVAKKRP